ncbi:hypothetical protein CORC01_01342 [Colletotrichum orchidophilum]|uniref:Uncharacterized protein n=1 Tax=Colletotrichum orchidophilum TaxID=1209926 RepID=A0A1G4BPA9_9PEZI|nr:uncharacterized protein CORC01_01342 [Colletotrichum orchidophilum]OHF03289.1 hypothetical protein CORC01_01342 [Colletotrichum orchidophilum]
MLFVTAHVEDQESRKKSTGLASGQEQGTAASSSAIDGRSTTTAGPFESAGSRVEDPAVKRASSVPQLLRPQNSTKRPSWRFLTASRYRRGPRLSGISMMAREL